MATSSLLNVWIIRRIFSFKWFCVRVTWFKIVTQTVINRVGPAGNCSIDSIISVRNTISKNLLTTAEHFLQSSPKYQHFARDYLSLLIRMFESRKWIEILLKGVFSNKYNHRVPSRQTTIHTHVHTDGKFSEETTIAQQF